MLTPRQKRLDKINAKREDWEEEMNLFLRDYGWERTCSTPGAYWLWQKTLPDGRTMLLHAEQAVDIESQLREPT